MVGMPERPSCAALIGRAGLPLRADDPERGSRRNEGITKPFSFNGMKKIVHTMRDKIGLPSTFTLDACRHGGMTELEEAELTDGQGRALSAHRGQQAYEGMRSARWTAPSPQVASAMYDSADIRLLTSNSRR
jgi:hypothetical protein